MVYTLLSIKYFESELFLLFHLLYQGGKKCNYHLVAAFISKLCFSAQQWTNFTYHDQLMNINQATCRVWPLLKGYKPTQSRRDKQLIFILHFINSQKQKKTSSIHHLRLRWRSEQNNIPLALASTLQCNVTASRARGCVRAI